MEISKETENEKFRFELVLFHISLIRRIAEYTVSNNDLFVVFRFFYLKLCARTASRGLVRVRLKRRSRPVVQGLYSFSSYHSHMCYNRQADHGRQTITQSAQSHAIRAQSISISDFFDLRRTSAQPTGRADRPTQKKNF